MLLMIESKPIVAWPSTAQRDLWLHPNCAAAATVLWRIRTPAPQLRPTADDELRLRS